LRINAESHVGEAHRLDQRKVMRGGVRNEVFPGVTLWARDLGEPSADVYPVPKMGQSLGGNAARSLLRREFLL